MSRPVFYGLPETRRGSLESIDQNVQAKDRRENGYGHEKCGTGTFSRSRQSTTFIIMKLGLALLIILGTTSSLYWATSISSSPTFQLNFDGYKKLQEQVIMDLATISKMSLGIARLKELEFCTPEYEHYVPCYDNVSVSSDIKSPPLSNKHERNCIWESKEGCLVVPPNNYRIPLRWPSCRDFIWKENVKVTGQEFSSGAWNRRMMVEEEQITFRSNSLMVDGVEDYTDRIAEMIGLRNASNFNEAGVRTVLDIGCGFGSFGAHLFTNHLLTMCTANYETSGSQVLFTLERGIPAMIGSFTSKQLPYPYLSFDMLHCAGCGVEWEKNDGIFLVEVDRLLKPGGYFVWTATLTSHRSQPDKENQKITSKKTEDQKKFNSNKSENQKKITSEKTENQKKITSAETEKQKKITSAETENQKITSAETENQKKITSAETENQKITSAESENQKITSGRTEHQKITSGKTEDLKITSGKTEDQNITSGKTEDQKITSGKTEDRKIASGKTEDHKITSGKTEDQKINTGKTENQKASSGKTEHQKIASDKTEHQKIASDKTEYQKIASDKTEYQKITSNKTEHQKITSNKTENQKKITNIEKTEILKTTSEKTENQKNIVKTENQKITSEKTENQKKLTNTEAENQNKVSIIHDLAENLCWDFISQNEGTIVWKKTTKQDCYSSRKAGPSRLSVCDRSHDAESLYYQPLNACIAGTRSSRWIPIELHRHWPDQSRLNSTDLAIYDVRIEEFIDDATNRMSMVEDYWSLLSPVIFSDHPKRPNDEDPSPPFNMIRNVLDMNAHFGGFNAALLDSGKSVWVMNVVPTTGPNHLPLIFDRGFIGVQHDWCEAFPTYPRTYDLVLAEGLLSLETQKPRCPMLAIFLEIDRILRPEGWMIVDDAGPLVEEARTVTMQLKWDGRVIALDSSSKRKILVCQKPFFRKQH